MTVHLVTFSDQSMSRSAELCVSSGKAHGVDRYIWFPWDQLVHVPTYKANQALFDHPRGLGYWAWKPYVIDQEIKFCKPGDILIYSDAGVEFIDNVKYIIDRMDQDVFLFGNMWEHAHWCKRDVVEAVCPPLFGASMPWERFGKQVQASVIFFRVSDYSKRFVSEWLKWCLFEGGRLIDDSPSRTPNHPEFREHRHDQAILTTLAYRQGLKLHWWPASYNDGQFIYEKGVYTDDYPALFNHHRRRNHEWQQCA